MINAASMARSRPVFYIIEDAQWIDSVSESMLADVLASIPRMPSMMMTTFRPEYVGALAHRSDAQTIALAPLSDSETVALLAQLVGSDPSVGDLTASIADRAAGNPFFVEEMVRELAQRGVLRGEHGSYVCAVNSADVSVPVTVQAAIEARIDRLDAAAKRMLNAASVIGDRFGVELLTMLAADPALDNLVGEELIDQVRAAPSAEYAFRHPLIRAVAYESQLQSVRADLHRQLAAAIGSVGPGSTESNAALIAEHLEAAGDLRAAYDWHMRAGAWSANRDIAAASLSWERALRIATTLPDPDEDVTAMRIAPLRMLCGTAWRVNANIADRFEELRELCASVGDKASLAIGMAGVVTEHLFCGRVREASRLASEQMALLESIGDPGLTIEAGFMAIFVKYHCGEIADVLRWSATVIDWAEGDPAKGNLIVGSPLALALVWRGIARFWLGRDGWREDLTDAVATARHTDPSTRAWVVIWKNHVSVGYGVLLPDDAVVRELEEALHVAERTGDDTALGLVKYTLGVVLVYRGAAADRQRGLELVEQVRGMCLQRQFYRSELPALDFSTALEMVRRGDRDGAIRLMREAVDQVFDEGRGLTYGVAGIAGLVETLLSRGAAGDIDEARRAIDRLANLPSGDGLTILEITLLRLRALLSMARGDDIAYRDLTDRYRAMAESLGFEGHIAMARAMAED
jgi:hypothetical protein